MWWTNLSCDEDNDLNFEVDLDTDVSIDEDFMWDGEEWVELQPIAEDDLIVWTGEGQLVLADSPELDTDDRTAFDRAMELLD